MPYKIQHHFLKHGTFVSTRILPTWPKTLHKTVPMAAQRWWLGHGTGIHKGKDTWSLLVTQFQQWE